MDDKIGLSHEEKLESLKLKDMLILKGG